MPMFGSAFADDADTSLGVATAIEIARAESAVGSTTRRELTPRRIDVTYEAAFLRVFAEWEVFLEEVTVRYMCGYHCSLYNPTPVPGGRIYPTLSSAGSALRGRRQFLLWHNVQRNVDLVKRFLQLSPIEVVSNSSIAWLTDVALVRHRIAHRTEDSRAEFDSATRRLAGRRISGSSAGRFLRSSAPSGNRWIDELTLGLKGLAQQIAP